MPSAKNKGRVTQRSPSIGGGAATGRLNMRSRVKGFEQALRGAYVSNHAADRDTDLSTTTLLKHLSHGCPSCARSFEIRREKLDRLRHDVTAVAMQRRA